jgi:hypothetical protein
VAVGEKETFFNAATRIGGPRPTICGDLPLLLEGVESLETTLEFKEEVEVDTIEFKEEVGVDTLAFKEEEEEEEVEVDNLGVAWDSAVEVEDVGECVSDMRL